jgi:hypothetical protein
MSLKSLLNVVAALALASGTSFATSTVVAHYRMGELEIAGGAAVGDTPPALLVTVGTPMTALTGTPTIVAGDAVTASHGSSHYMNFDGVLEHYEITPTISGMNASNGWMLEAWVRPQAGGSGLGLIMSNGHGGSGQTLNYDAAANRYGWLVGGVGLINGTVGASGVGTSWDHLALVRNANTTTLYVNGVVAGSNTALGTFGYANGCAIGSQYTGGGDHGFTGDIDEVYFSTISGTFDPVTDLHLMIIPADPIILVPAVPTSAGTVIISTATNFTVPVSNTGVANTLTISAVSAVDGDTGRFSLVTTLPLDILPGATAELEFQYQPGATAASHSATFSVDNNSTGNPNASIVLTGSAITDPNITVAGSLDLGTVASIADVSKDLEVFNSGVNQNLNITSAIVTGGDSAYFSITSSPSPVLPGSSVVITVKYAPAGNLGSHSAVLEITHDDPDLASPIQVALSGNSIPRLSVIAQYHLGEDDVSLATTTDAAGDYDLTNINPTPATSYNSGAGAGTGSTKGIDHTLNDVYTRNGIPAALAGRTKNWGIQTWIRPELSTGSGEIGAGYGGLYFGVGFGGRGGFSIFSDDGAHWGLNMGGFGAPHSVVPIQGGTWTHVAAVALDNQIVLYVNGIVAYTHAGLVYAPDDNAGGVIELGGLTGNAWRVAGGVDEASVFSFVSGQFNPATDLHVTPPADADGDGLLDTWEDKYFANNDGVVTWVELASANGSGDADGDTFTDKQEHDAGTDPKDNSSFPANEVLAITSITKAGNTTAIQFTGVDGKTYVLKKSLTLADGFPTTCDTITLTGTSTGTLQDASATETNAFYRVERP